MEAAAVNRLAKSITQLTLCQVTTDEVDSATKLLDKACQKLRGIPDVPFQRITDLEAAIRQMRQLSCILDSCTISASYEVSQAQKAILLIPRTAKVQARHLKSWMHRCHRSQMKNIIFQLMKTIGKSTSVPESTGPWQLSKWTGLDTGPFLPAALLLNARNYPRVWWSEKHYWADSERTLRAVSAPSPFLTLALVSPSVSPFFSPLSLRRGFVVVCFEVTNVSCYAVTACAMWSRGSWLGGSLVSAWCFVASLTLWYGLVILLFFPLFLLPYHVKMIQCYHSCIN